MAKKIDDQDKIRANNLIERASEIVEPCINCGLCKNNSAVFGATKEENLTPRGFSNMLKNKTLNQDFFKSNLDGSCKRICPMKIDIDEVILAVREALFLQGKGLKKKKTN